MIISDGSAMIGRRGGLPYGIGGEMDSWEFNVVIGDGSAMIGRRGGLPYGIG